MEHSLLEQIFVIINPLIATEEHPYCFLCGAKNPKSLNLQFEALDDNCVRSLFTANDELQGYKGILHGGIIAALLDAAMTHCMFHLGIKAVTADLHIRYVTPVSCRNTLDIRGRLLSSHAHLYFLRGEIIIKNKTAVWAESKFLARKPPRLTTDHQNSYLL